MWNVIIRNKIKTNESGGGLRIGFILDYYKDDVLISSEQHSLRNYPGDIWLNEEIKRGIDRLTKTLEWKDTLPDVIDMDKVMAIDVTSDIKVNELNKKSIELSKNLDWVRMGVLTPTEANIDALRTEVKTLHDEVNK